jgi:predicted metal-dependent hydrolase
MQKEQQVRVIRSTRRRRTISARVVAGVLEVRIPRGASDDEERAWVERMRQWAERRDRRRQRLANLDDSALERRADSLNKRYFDGKLKFTVRYVANQESRFGSCSPNGSIRIADRVSRLPSWVSDYVLMHELAHIVVPDHSRAFWRTVAKYPLAERARGYMMALGAEETHDATDKEDTL